jgi:predicted metal-dependent phosphoesterase TrpH
MVGELHCHTNLSVPKWVHRMLPSPEEVVDRAVSVGLDFLVITDHDSFEAFEVVESYARKKGLVLVPGAEITTKPSTVLRRRCHILAIGVTDAVKSFITIEDTLKQIKDRNGIAIAAHPFCSQFAKTLYIGHQVGDYAFDGIEVFNSSEISEDNRKSAALATVLGLPGFAGSDAHSLENIGKARVEVYIEHTKDWRNIVRGLRENKFEIVAREYATGGFKQFFFGHFLRKYSQ